ncbi:hypothetical protein Tco_0814708 [Tanacetum coccineum]
MLAVPQADCGSIAGRIQAPKKLTVTDLFYLRGMDVGSAPQAPPAAGPARTMTHRLARLEEDVHEMRGALGEQREAGVRYMSYSDYHIPYVRRTRCKTDDASTSAP